MLNPKISCSQQEIFVWGVGRFDRLSATPHPVPSPKGEEEFLSVRRKYGEKRKVGLVLSTVRSTMKSDHQTVKVFVNFVLLHMGK